MSRARAALLPVVLVVVLLGACRQAARSVDATLAGTDPVASDGGGGEAVLEAASAPLAVWVDEDGPWTEIPPEDDPAASTRPAEPVVAAEPLQVPSRPSPPPVPALAVPRRRYAVPESETRPPPEVQRRERYLSHPTHLRAQRITFYCPRVYLREVQLGADDVREPTPGRRVATGRARLLCRELTLEADRIVLKVRDAADADLQLTASGGVAFATDQKGQVLREEGARMLMITNEQVTPLR